VSAFSSLVIGKKFVSCKINQGGGGSGFQPASLAQAVPAQQSVQRTGLRPAGTGQLSQQSLWLAMESSPSALPLTHTVVPLLQIRKDDKSKQRMTESVTHGNFILWR